MQPFPMAEAQRQCRRQSRFERSECFGFAKRVLQEAGTDPERQVKTMYRIAFSREPAPRELENNLAFLTQQKGPAGAALTDLAHVILNLNEFIYIQ